jgi:hypothetical protein
MPGNGKRDETEPKSQLNTTFDSTRTDDDKTDTYQSIMAWRSTDTEWKDHHDEFLPPGNYKIHTHATDTDTAHATVTSLLDELTDYHIWDTREVYSSAKARRRDDPAHKHVLVRTTQPIPVDELPDTPRITSY